MLQADPALRFRSMDQVIDALDATPAQLAALPPLPPPSSAIGAQGSGRRAGVSPVLVAGMGLVALAITGGLVAALVTRRENRPTPPPVVGAQAETTMDAALRSVPCAWLTDRMSRGPDGLHIEMNGAAGDPAGAVAQITQALQKAGSPVAAADRSQLRLLPPSACQTISAIARLHAPTSELTWIRPQAVVFNVQPSPICGGDPHQATSVVTVRPPPAGQEENIALLKVEDTGAMTRIFSGLAEFRALARAPTNGKGHLFEDLGPQGLRVSLCEKTGGLKGALVIRGKPPFDLSLPAITNGEAASPPGLATGIVAGGKAQGWRTQMAWYDVDTTPLAVLTAAKAAAPASHRPRPIGAPGRPGSLASAAPPPAAAPAKDKPDTLGTDFR